MGPSVHPSADPLICLCSVNLSVLHLAFLSVCLSFCLSVCLLREKGAPKLTTRPYTRQYQSRAGGQGQYGSWEGAVTKICSPFSSKRPETRSDYGPTDRRTDRRTDKVHATKEMR